MLKTKIIIDFVQIYTIHFTVAPNMTAWVSLGWPIFQHAPSSHSNNFQVLATNLGRQVLWGVPKLLQIFLES
jgi:hypothetical protein